MPFHLPFHKYLGPGTSDFDQLPINEADSIARQHDLEYNEAKSYSDIYQSDKGAYKRFFEDFISSGSLPSLIGASGLYTKNKFEENLLKRPLYPTNLINDSDSMPPPTKRPKNWAAIRRINLARARAREQRQQEEANNQQSAVVPNRHQDQEDELDLTNWFDNEFFGDNTANDSGNNNKNTNTMGAIDPVSTVGEAPMDIQADSGVVRNASGRGGSSSGSGTPSTGASDIYNGSTQSCNSHIKEFSKSYHFTIGNGLPRHRLNNTISYGLCNQIQYQSIHCIPWHRLAMYCSEGEIIRLYTNYSMCEVMQVECEVYSLGVRLPFVTGQSVSLVANSQAQYPIGKFNFDKDFLCSQEQAPVLDIVKKCLGEEWKQSSGNATLTWSENFANISASTTNRQINNPVIVNFPCVVGSNGVQMFPKDVGIYDYVDIKNGSTIYGKCWHEIHKPNNGRLFCKSNEALGNMANNNISNWPNLVESGANIFEHQGLYPEQYAMRNQNRDMRLTTEGVLGLPFDIFTVGVDGNMVYKKGENTVLGTNMPFFMIGLVNVRNLAEGQPLENTILEGKWDIMVKTKIKIKCIDNIQSGYINRIVENVPLAYAPMYRIVENSGILYTGNPGVKHIHNKCSTDLLANPMAATTAEQLEIINKHIKKYKNEKLISQDYKNILENHTSLGDYKQHTHVLHPKLQETLKFFAEEKNLKTS